MISMTQLTLDQRGKSCSIYITSRVFVLFISLFLGLFLVLSAVSQVRAADEVVHFDNPLHMQMYQALLKEYRCLKCQNQNLWDSNADLAGDLRKEIREQILAGKNKTDIDEYLVARYGEFVLYRPRFTAKTAILWVGPFLLFFVALASLALFLKGRSTSERENVSENVLPERNVVRSDDELERARRLLGHE